MYVMYVCMYVVCIHMYVVCIHMYVVCMPCMCLLYIHNFCRYTSSTGLLVLSPSLLVEHASPSPFTLAEQASRQHGTDNHADSGAHTNREQRGALQLLWRRRWRRLLVLYRDHPLVKLLGAGAQTRHSRTHFLHFVLQVLEAFGEARFGRRLGIQGGSSAVDLPPPLVHIHGGREREADQLDAPHSLFGLVLFRDHPLGARGRHGGVHGGVLLAETDAGLDALPVRTQLVHERLSEPGKLLSVPFEVLRGREVERESGRRDALGDLGVRYEVHGHVVAGALADGLAQELGRAHGVFVSGDDSLLSFGFHVGKYLELAAFGA